MMSMMGGQGMGAAGTGVGSGPSLPGGGQLSPQVLAMLMQMGQNGGQTPPGGPANAPMTGTPMANYIGASGNPGAMQPAVVVSSSFYDGLALLLRVAWVQQGCSATRKEAVSGETNTNPRHPRGQTDVVHPKFQEVIIELREVVRLPRTRRARGSKVNGQRTQCPKDCWTYCRS